MAWSLVGPVASAGVEDVVEAGEVAVVAPGA